MTTPNFGSVQRRAEQLEVSPERQQAIRDNAAIWEKIRSSFERFEEQFLRARPTYMLCGPGVWGWLKETLPTIKDPSSPFGVAEYAGVQVIEDLDMAPGTYKITDQYGATLREGMVPER